MKHLFISTLIIIIIIIFNKISVTNLVLFPGCFMYSHSPKYVMSKGCDSVASHVDEKNSPVNDCLVCDIDIFVWHVFNFCRNVSRCLTFMFYNETIFEQFFNRHSSEIEAIFRTYSNPKLPKLLEIGFRNYDPEKITFKYLKSFISKDSPLYSRLVISFIAPRTNHSYGSMAKNFLDPFVNETMIRFSRNRIVDDQKWAKYIITPNRNDFFYNKTIKKSSKTSTVSLYKATILEMQNSSSNATSIIASLFTRQKLYYVVPSSFIVVGSMSIFILIFTRYYCRKEAVDANVQFNRESFYSESTNDSNKSR